MTIFKDIVTIDKPTTKEEVLSYFDNDERIKGKELKSFDVREDVWATESDPYTYYVNVYANHYEIAATFE